MHAAGLRTIRAGRERGSVGTACRCKSLDQALEHYTAKAVLDGNNKYRCPLNNKLVKAVCSLLLVCR